MALGAFSRMERLLSDGQAWGEGRDNDVLLWDKRERALHHRNPHFWKASAGTQHLTIRILEVTHLAGPQVYRWCHGICSSRRPALCNPLASSILPSARQSHTHTHTRTSHTLTHRHSTMSIRHEKGVIRTTVRWCGWCRWSALASR